MTALPAVLKRLARKGSQATLNEEVRRLFEGPLPKGGSEQRSDAQAEGRLKAAPIDPFCWASTYERPRKAGPASRASWK